MNPMVSGEHQKKDIENISTKINLTDFAVGILLQYQGVGLIILNID